MHLSSMLQVSWFPGAQGPSSGQGCSGTMKQSELWGHLLRIFYSEQKTQKITMKSQSFGSEKSEKLRWKGQWCCVSGVILVPDRTKTYWGSGTGRQHRGHL